MAAVTNAFSSGRYVLGIMLVLASLVSACGPAKVPTADVIVTSNGDLDRHIGERISVEGEISRTKIPQIIGVDVDVDDDDVGKVARATGVLHREVVTKDDRERDSTIRTMTADRGPGTFYWLVDDYQHLAHAYVLR